MSKTVQVEIVVNKKPMTLEAAPRLTVLAHQQGTRVDIPTFTEVNGRNALECMEKMSQKAWEHISTGELFQHLFTMVFPKEDGKVEIPKTIEDLVTGDIGVTHIAGMIVLCCEACFDNPAAKIFLRTPEDHLHPKAERRLIKMVTTLQSLLGGSGGVATLTDEEHK